MQLAAHQRGQLLTDSQAQASAWFASLAATGSAPLKGQKNALVVLRQNTQAGVDHVKAKYIRPIGGAQSHRAIVGKADGIGDQVNHHLAQALGIGINPLRRVTAFVKHQLQALGLHLRAHHAHQFFQKIRQMQRHGV